MKSKHLVAVFFSLLVAFLAFKFTENTPHSSSTATINGTNTATCASSSFSLITEPAAGTTPVLAMIDNATKSVDLVMYELADKQVEASLVAAEQRGVAVRVLLDAGYQGQPRDENVEAYNFFDANDVPVHWTPKYFTLTHEKSLVVDGVGLIMSFNLTPQYYADDRDFGIVDGNSCDVAAMKATFDSDWAGTDGAKAVGNNGDGGTDLVWSPNSRQAMLSIMANASRTLDVYNEEMADPGIESALKAAAHRGIEVNVVMTYSSEWKNAFTKLKAAGVHIRTYSATASLYIHAKMILADAGQPTGSQVFIGSENFSPTSLDKNRELGIVLTDENIVKSLAATFNADWHNGAPF